MDDQIKNHHRAPCFLDIILKQKAKKMSDMTIKEFCDLHNASQRDVNWALESHNSMKECWEKLSPGHLIWVATRKGVLTNRELRLFAVYCCREIWHLLSDHRSRGAVKIAAKFANNLTTEEALKAAEATAWAATCDSRRYTGMAAEATARTTMQEATEAATWTSETVARTVIMEAVETAAAWTSETTAWTTAAWATAAATQANQAAWLHKHTKPNFKKPE